MGGAHALPVEVVDGAKAVEDHAARPDLALSGDGQHLVDAAAELGVDHHLREHAAHRSIELGGRIGELLSGGDRDRERVDVQLGGARRDQADLHGALKVNDQRLALSQMLRHKLQDMRDT